MKMNESTPKTTYPTVGSDMVFQWECTNCGIINQITYNNWKYHKGSTECHKCEAAHTVEEPWDE